MIHLKVSCPHCRKVQPYLSYSITHRAELSNKKKICIVCDRQFKVANNVVEEVEFK